MILWMFHVEPQSQQISGNITVTLIRFSYSCEKVQFTIITDPKVLKQLY